MIYTGHLVLLPWVKVFVFGWVSGGKLQEGRNGCRSSVEELTT